MEEFFTLLETVLKSESLLKIVFSSSRDRSVKKAAGRIITVKGLRTLQIETLYADGKARHKNLPEKSAGKELRDLCPLFKQVNLFTTAGECEALFSQNGKCHMKNRITGEFSQSVPEKNDRAHRYVLDPVECAPFLSKLGVCSPEGEIYEKKTSKFRQINRFVEILSDVYPHLPREGELTVCDLCCGKSYLTFAVYYYLTVLCKRKVKLYGVDLKSDVIDFCRRTAEELGFDGMEFSCMDIFSFSPSGGADLVVSLHACDIATDIVLHNAMRLQAKVILSTPCCHHEMMRQLNVPELSFVSQHSLLRQKICEAFTDALRCKMLEAGGYKVTTLELIDPEETPKNLMIKAVRGGVSEEKKKKAMQEYEEAVRFLQADPYLYELQRKGEGK